ncbi:hypothetical protein GUJ93_ZPchr0002g25879 [Zizania palustris]|uniref:Secreted protein n=1 Tax=Zizania palustris TaxID=103762 RepID=A0A8J5SQ21_ZIZPA|nr:hypothetical protein GUJ93_ZPchr0002g25879 [Zizania palustris]
MPPAMWGHSLQVIALPLTTLVIAHNKWSWRWPHVVVGGEAAACKRWPHVLGGGCGRRGDRAWATGHRAMSGAGGERGAVCACLHGHKRHKRGHGRHERDVARRTRARCGGCGHDTAWNGRRARSCHSWFD